jgi:hypothetical protein
MARHMEAARQYTWQMGPFGRVSVENVGSVSAAALGVAVPWSLQSGVASEIEAGGVCVAAGVAAAAEIGGGGRCEAVYALRAKRANAMFKTAAAAFADQHCNDTSTICFLFVPPLFGSHSDVSSRQTGRGVMVSGTVLGLNSLLSPPSSKTEWEQNRWIANGADLAHETGHSFGLYHVPLRVGGSARNFWESVEKEDFQHYEAEGGRFPGIDGVRMRLDGTSGIFKSSKHGNPENRRLLAPLMFPNLLPKGAVQIMDLQYHLWLQRLSLGSPVYGLGDHRFSDPDPKDPEERVGQLLENTITYNRMRSNLINSNIAIFDDRHLGNLDRETRAIGYAPNDARGRVDGIITTFSVLQDDDGAAIYPVIRPTHAVETPAPVTRDTEGAQITLVALADNETLAELTFWIADGMEQDMSVFVALSPDDLTTLTSIVLRSTDDTILFTQDIPKLPDTQSATLSQGPDGVSILDWVSQGTPSTVAIAFENAQDGQLHRVAIGSTTDTGRFVFNTARTGIFGTGEIKLTFDTGIATKVISVPASLESPFVSVISGQDGSVDQPQLFVAFNRPLLPDLPPFALLTDGKPVDIALSSHTVDGHLYIYPSEPLAPCTAYSIVAQSPLFDQIGNPLDETGKWALITRNASDDCPQAAPVRRASLSMTRNAQTQTMVGEADVDAATPAIRLTFPRQTVVLSPALLSQGTYGLSSVSRGESRREIILDYKDTDAVKDVLTITESGGILVGEFTATVSGGTLQGAFEIKR